MSQQQKLELQIRGLYTSPNNLSGVPPGALEIADNLVINSKSLASSRKGQTQYGDVLTIGSGQINKIFNYSSSLIVNYDDKLAYDAGSGNWTDYSGTFNAPSNDYRMRSLEALKNFYFTTDAGIYKLDAINGTPVPAGAPRALGMSGTSSGTGGFLLEDSAVAYQMVWGYVDANNNLILGAPSQRLIVENPGGSGVDTDVALTILIPDDITVDHFYQIYRSLGTATDTDEPSAELQLALQGNPDTGDISAGYISLTDSTPYSLLRQTLYTSPSQEGAANANFQPPFAYDMDVFKTCAFYANVLQKQSLSLAMIAVESPSFGYVVDATVATHTNFILDSITDTSILRVGMRAVGTGIVANSLIASIDSPTQVTLSIATTATATVSVEFQDRISIAGTAYWAGTTQTPATNTFIADISGTPGTNINETAINLVTAINTSPDNDDVYAYYVSALNDLPGQMQFVERAIGGSVFYATSTAGTSFSPPLPASGTTIVSNNEVRQNRVFVSKASQPEAVPIYRYFDIGSANFPIQRVVALRDGIFFFKLDGIYRISGESFENFVVTLIDNTVVLQVPESAVPFNNQVFCFTTQGICAVTDSGVKIMSVPIENTLLTLSSDQYTNFDSASFGVAYESERLYIFATVTQEDDEFATQAFVYNSLTDSWTRWIMDRTCGVVNTAVNKLFMGQPDTGQVLIERKSFTNADFADEQYAVTIASVDSTTQVTLSDASDVEDGMTLGQGSRTAYIESVVGNVLTIVATNGFTTGAALVYTPILNKIRWAPIDAENPGILKQFSEMTMFFRNAAFQEIDATFYSNISASSAETIPVFNTVNIGGWGLFDWGELPWGGQLGGQVSLRTYVPANMQRAMWLNLTLTTEEAFTGFSLQGISLIFSPMTSRFK